MKILVVGSGGREHALVWKLKQSHLVSKIYAAPGNDGIAQIAETVPLKVDDLDGLARFARENAVDLTVVGPELPLTLGIVDHFEERGLRIFGPTREAAEIEGSKAFAKTFMRKYHIPTGSFQVFEDRDSAIAFVERAAYPLVIKASGLAAGKGAVIINDNEEAKNTINQMMIDRIFGEAGLKVVIEEFLQGEELTVMAFTDGKTILPMLSSQDHKKIDDGDAGPNTGGMGAYCPTLLVDDQMMQMIKDQILVPAIHGLEEEGRRYKGILYAGLMVTPVGPKVIEFNCRMGDPETQAVLPLLESDLADLFIAIADGNLRLMEPQWSDGAAACVVISSRGYPGKAETGKKIDGLTAQFDDSTYIFHSGTKRDENNWITSGGRVLGVTAVRNELRSAIDAAYDAVDKIHFEGMHYRKDIGHLAFRKLGA